MNPFKMDGETVYLVSSNHPHFFYYQDFYIEDDSVDFEMDVQINQKFTDRALVDFVIEFFDFDVDETKNPENLIDHHYAPQCLNKCLIGGQKSFNEFSNKIEFDSKILFRLWLFKHSNDDPHDKDLIHQCGNF